jgi:hypothetical protein
MWSKVPGDSELRNPRPLRVRRVVNLQLRPDLDRPLSERFCPARFDGTQYHGVRSSESISYGNKYLGSVTAVTCRGVGCWVYTGDDRQRVVCLLAKGIKSCYIRVSLRMMRGVRDYGLTGSSLSAPVEYLPRKSLEANTPNSVRGGLRLVRQCWYRIGLRPVNSKDVAAAITFKGQMP